MDGILGRLGFLNRPLDAASLIALARRRTGLTDFGDDDFAAPLERFLQSTTNEFEPQPGRPAGDALGHGALPDQPAAHARSRTRRAPAIRDEPIDRADLHHRPAAQRHHLPAPADDGGRANRAPLVWQTIYPYPPGRAGRGPAGRRASRGSCGRSSGWRRNSAALHPLEATSPQECSEITAHVFRSLRFDTTYHMPSYRRWLDATPATCRPIGSTSASCSICSTSVQPGGRRAGC